MIEEFNDQVNYKKACRALDEGFEDGFSYTIFRKSHNRLNSTNILERLNEEVILKEKVIRTFINTASANRLMDVRNSWISP